MVELVIHQLRAIDPALVPADAGAVDAIRQANVPGEIKRDMLEFVWRELGPETLLRTGQGIRTVGHDPIWQAAMRSASPALLFDKWQRFEVFAHTRNRVRIEPLGENRTVFHRYTTEGGTPTAPENLLICGLIIALLEEIGCTGLRCEMALNDGKPFCILDNDEFSLPGDPGTLITTAWTLDWRDVVPRNSDAVGADERVEFPLPEFCNAERKAEIESVLRILTGDVARQWKIEALAREAGMSARSLQRKLHDAELSFSRLVRLVRVREACRLLSDSDASITVIGFCAGFSGSAHLSRDFRASMGMSPSNYRALSRVA